MTRQQMTRYDDYHHGELVALREDEEIVHTEQNEDGTLTFWTKKPKPKSS